MQIRYRQIYEGKFITKLYNRTSLIQFNTGMVLQLKDIMNFLSLENRKIYFKANFRHTAMPYTLSSHIIQVQKRYRNK